MNPYVGLNHTVGQFGQIAQEVADLYQGALLPGEVMFDKSVELRRRLLFLPRVDLCWQWNEVYDINMQLANKAREGIV